MKEEEYKHFLEKAPTDHFSKEFILFLINNNEVVFLSDRWLIIKNKKYHTEEKPWLTAFFIGMDKKSEYDMLASLVFLWTYFPEARAYEWMIKAPSKRTVKLHHIHLYQK